MLTRHHRTSVAQITYQKTLQKEKAALTFISFSGFSMELFFFFSKLFFGAEKHDGSTQDAYSAASLPSRFLFSATILYSFVKEFGSFISTNIRIKAEILLLVSMKVHLCLLSSS